MFSVAENNNFLLRLSADQRKKVKRLAKAAGMSVNEYMSKLIDAHYAKDGATLAQLEQMQEDLVTATPLPKAAGKR
jgi:hypothetical protein